MTLYCLYHANCVDGFTAAAVVKSYDPSMRSHQFIPMNYGDTVPDFPADATVIMVDFSLKRQQILDLCNKVAGVIVLDHHKTAQAELDGLEAPNLVLMFDMTRCGAMLTFRYLYAPSSPVPRILEYVQDRDLWTWKLPNSREVSAYVASVDKTFTEYEKLLREDKPFSEVITIGSSLLKQQQGIVESLCTKNMAIAKFLGHRVPMVNSAVFQSEIGERLNQLLPESPFSLVYYIIAHKVRVSLRSTFPKPGTLDVSAVAKAVGGGGHAAAAGCEIPLDVFFQGIN